MRLSYGGSGNETTGVLTDNYKETQFRDLSTEKNENMKLMYNQLVSPERRPDYLPPFVSVINATSRSSNTSSSNSVPPPAKRPRKQSSRSTHSYDWTGHKEPSTLG